LHHGRGMDATALHLELRNAITLSDELGRHEHALGDDDLAGHLAAVRTTLGELERLVGRSHERQVSPKPTLIDRLETSRRILRDRLEEIPVSLRLRVGELMASLERIIFAELRPSSPVPAKPVLGGLPLRRVVPQSVHSLADYVAAIALLASAELAKTRRGRVVGLVLAAKHGGVSLLTDARFTAARVISIEVHEMVDYGAGIGAVMAPFLLRYRKRDRLASSIQIMTGLGMLLVSLFTDYRAEHGVGRAVRSRGGPRARRLLRKQRAAAKAGEKTKEGAARPLEGLAGPSVLPRMRL